MTDDATEDAWRNLVDATLVADLDGERRALAELERLLHSPIPTQREPQDRYIDWSSPEALLLSEVATLRAAVEAATACLETRRFDEALDVLLGAEAPARSGRLRFYNRRQR